MRSDSEIRSILAAIKVVNECIQRANGRFLEDAQQSELKENLEFLLMKANELDFKKSGERGFLSMIVESVEHALVEVTGYLIKLGLYADACQLVDNPAVIGRNGAWGYENLIINDGVSGSASLTAAKIEHGGVFAIGAAYGYASRYGDNILLHEDKQRPLSLLLRLIDNMKSSYFRFDLSSYLETLRIMVGDLTVVGGDEGPNLAIEKAIELDSIIVSGFSDAIRRKGDKHQAMPLLFELLKSEHSSKLLSCIKERHEALHAMLMDSDVLSFVYLKNLCESESLTDIVFDFTSPKYQFVFATYMKKAIGGSRVLGVEKFDDLFKLVKPVNIGAGYSREIKSIHKAAIGTIDWFLKADKDERACLVHELPGGSLVLMAHRNRKEKAYSAADLRAVGAAQLELTCRDPFDGIGVSPDHLDFELLQAMVSAGRRKSSFDVAEFFKPYMKNKATLKAFGNLTYQEVEWLKGKDSKLFSPDFLAKIDWKHSTHRVMKAANGFSL